MNIIKKFNEVNDFNSKGLNPLWNLLFAFLFLLILVPQNAFAIDTCTDGIQNQDETGIDTGGICTPVPATCTDGIQNQDETGIDTGGICTPGSYQGPNFQEWLFVNGIIIFFLSFQTWGIIYRPSTKLIK